MAIVKGDDVRNTKKVPKIYQDYINMEKEWIIKKISSSKSLIDIGCGEGRATEFLSKITDHYLGVDLDPKAISNAKKLENKKIKFELLDVTKLSSKFGKTHLK